METIKVKADTASGFMIINKSDFDENKHVKFSEQTETQTKQRRTRRKKAE